MTFDCAVADVRMLNGVAVWPVGSGSEGNGIIRA